MADYVLQPDEYVVLKAQEVKLDGKSSFSMSNGSELMLTNKSIVLPIKGMFGKTKRCEVYPLESIRILDGRPLVRLDTSEFMTDKLEVTFASGVVSFVFGSLEARQEIRTWINELHKLLVGTEAPKEAFGGGGLSSTFGIEETAEGIGKVMGSFFNAFDKKTAEAAPVVAYRCPSCDASLKGKVGETVTCPFCGSNVTIGQ